jgi:hypothetical protein
MALVTKGHSPLGIRRNEFSIFGYSIHIYFGTSTDELYEHSVVKLGDS